MRFTRAAMAVPVGTDGDIEEPVALTTGHAARLELARRSGGWLAPTHSVLRWSMTEKDSDQQPVLLDEFDIYGGFVTVTSDAVVITGFARGTCGKTREGGPVMVWEDGEAISLQEEREPFLPVRWTLS